MDESHEPGVFHALGLRTHGRQKHLLAQRCALLESNAVAPLGDPAHEADGPLCLFASGNVVLEEPEPYLHLRLGEPRSEVTQDVVGVIPASMDPTKFSLECLSLEKRLSRRPVDAKVGMGSKSTSPEPVSVPVRKPIEELWPSPMALTLITNRRRTRADSRLIWMHHHARIAECCALYGVLTGERRTEQQSAGWRQLELGVEAIRELICMAKERLGQAVMSTFETRHVHRRSSSELHRPRAPELGARQQWIATPVGRNLRVPARTGGSPHATCRPRCGRDCDGPGSMRRPIIARRSRRILRVATSTGGRASTRCPG